MSKEGKVKIVTDITKTTSSKSHQIKKMKDKIVSKAFAKDLLAKKKMKAILQNKKSSLNAPKKDAKKPKTSSTGEKSKDDEKEDDG